MCGATDYEVNETGFREVGNLFRCMRTHCGMHAHDAHCSQQHRPVSPVNAGRTFLQPMPALLLNVFGEGLGTSPGALADALSVEHEVHVPHSGSLVAIDAHGFSLFVGGFSCPLLTARVRNLAVMSGCLPDTHGFHSFFVRYVVHSRATSAARRSLSACSSSRLFRVAARAVVRVPQEREQYTLFRVERRM